MFTGLVQAVGVVSELSPTGVGMRLVIDPSGWAHRAAHGESISVSGVCLTHTGHAGARMLGFDVVPETLARTTLGALRAGSRVNLEHACRADALMGGHIVQGHVDGVGRVMGVNRSGGEWRVTVQPPFELMDTMAPKGSVTLEGVSLTVAASNERTFQVALIPTTLELTTLGELAEGSMVNIESDIIARTVVHWLERRRAAG